jgi:CRP/FNR family transcriptional regulator, cyclic AMP receptor protein
MDERQLSRLRLISLFEDLSDADLARVARLCVVRRYEKNARIAEHLGSGNDLFFILDGTVRASSMAADGREVIFTDLGVGNIVGELSAIDGLPRSSDMIASSDCLVARMQAAQFFDVLRENSTVAIGLVRLLAAKIRRMSDRVFEVSALGVGARLRRELLRLSADGARSGQEVTLWPAPTHYELAARIGSHREAVTRELGRLEKAGVLAVQRREIRIIDLARLQALDEE